MTRKEALRKIMESLGPDDILITSTGYNNRDAFYINDRPKNFYMLGSMGYELSVGIGIALKTKNNVVVVSGDGSALMILGSLVLANHLKLKNLKHYILDNCVYGSTGGQSTCSTSFNFNQFHNTEHIKIDFGPSPRIPYKAPFIKERLMKSI